MLHKLLYRYSEGKGKSIRNQTIQVLDVMPTKPMDTVRQKSDFFDNFTLNGVLRAFPLFNCATEKPPVTWKNDTQLVIAELKQNSVTNVREPDNHCGLAFFVFHRLIIIFTFAFLNGNGRYHIRRPSLYVARLQLSQILVQIVAESGDITLSLKNPHVSIWSASLAV